MMPLYAVIAVGLALATLHTASQTFARQKSDHDMAVRRAEMQIGPLVAPAGLSVGKTYSSE